MPDAISDLRMEPARGTANQTALRLLVWNSLLVFVLAPHLRKLAAGF